MHITCRHLGPKASSLCLLLSTLVVPIFAAEREILIPEKVVRTLLDFPQDGEVFSHVLKRDVWPKNKTEYDRNEMVEIAFGKGLRSKSGDRRKEKMMTPGIVFTRNSLRLQGGWRVHKEVPKHPDHFDGTFRGHLHLAIKRGEVEVSIDDLDLKWRRSLLAKLGGALLPIDVVGAVEARFENQIERQLEAGLRKSITEKLSAHVGAPLRQLSARIVPTGLLVRIETPNP